MNNELNRHKTSDKVKWWLTLIAFLLMGATMVGMLLGYIKPMETPKEPTKQEQEASVDNGGYVTETISSTGLSLFSATPMTYSEETGVATQTLYAAIRPETALNKNVTWSVAWAEENPEDVSKYLTVTPIGLESYFQKATVTCYQPFKGDIVITVTTEEGGHTAQCIAQYVGYPTDISVESNAYHDGEKYCLGAQGTFTFDLAAYNVFEELGDEYKDLKVTVTINGVFLVDDYHYDYQTETWSWSGNEELRSFDAISEEVFNYTYENGRLTVTTKEAIEGYYEDFNYADGGRTRYYLNKFKAFDTDCYVHVSIAQEASYTYKSFDFVIDPDRVGAVDMTDKIVF